jgi:hypothetical protein
MHAFQSHVWQQMVQIDSVCYIAENRREQSMQKPIGSQKNHCLTTTTAPHWFMKRSLNSIQHQQCKDQRISGS